MVQKFFTGKFSIVGGNCNTNRAKNINAKYRIISVLQGLKLINKQIPNQSCIWLT